jgi:RNA polymerase sigma-70 factor (ECF subfamily)
MSMSLPRDHSQVGLAPAGCTSPAFTAEAEALDLEADLVGRLRAGDEAAYEELVRTQGGRLLAVARRLLGNEADAQDAVQDAFLAAFRALPGFAGQSRLSTWLHRIVINAGLMKLRSRRRKPEETIDDLLPNFLEDGHHAVQFEEWRLPADVRLLRGETCRHVRAAIDRLPASYRTVLLMRDIEQLDTDETAELLGVTPNAVKIRLHRARQALRTLIDPAVRTPGAAAPVSQGRPDPLSRDNRRSVAGTA